MPGPPPPPAPPPPPNNLLAKPPANSGGRSALLADIQSGTRLKKAQTNDRSAPIIGKVVNPSSNSSNGSGPAAKPESKSSVPPPGLGGLFANGVPKKPSEAKSLQKTPANIPSPPPLKHVSTPPKQTPTKQFPPVQTSNNNAPTPPSSNSKPTPPKFPSKVQSTESISSAPLPPPKLKPTLPTQSSVPNFKKQSPPLSDSPQSPPFNTTLRPTPNATSNESLSSRKIDNGERTLKSGINRPGAPPPPPPQISSAQLKPNAFANKPRASPPKEVPTSPPNKTLPIRPAPPLPKSNPIVQQVLSRDAPLPPPRVSSYIDSPEHRFHFLPVHELPPPDAFVGFRKEYQNGYIRRAGAPPTY